MAALPYTSAMSCPELDGLRSAVSAMRIKLREEILAREKAQEMTGKLEHGDFEEYLKRKIARAAQEIEDHLRQHNCQEG